jgi:hypothetical protein
LEFTVPLLSHFEFAEGGRKWRKGERKGGSRDQSVPGSAPSTPTPPHTRVMMTLPSAGMTDVNNYTRSRQRPLKVK